MTAENVKKRRAWADRHGGNERQIGEMRLPRKHQHRRDTCHIHASENKQAKTHGEAVVSAE
jgi:hypothetical protein